MPYRSGTFDDLLAIRQRQRRQRRRIAEANTPSGSQPFQTTRKVEEIDLDLTSIANTATQANATAVEAKTLAQSASSVADNASEKADEAREMADAAETTLAGQSDRIDALADRTDSVEAALAASTVVATDATGTAMPAIGAAWTTLATLSIPEREGMTGALAVVSVNGCLTGGPSPVRVRLSVAGETVAEAPAPWAGDTTAYPGPRTGAHTVSLTGMASCAPGDDIAVEAMAGNAGDYPSSPDSALYVCARIDYRRELS